jgi:hypothetical protein
MTSFLASRASVVRSVVGGVPTGRGLSAFGNVEWLGLVGSVGTVLNVGDLVGDTTLCKLLDNVIEVAVALGPENASRLSKDICFTTCWACHDMGNNGPASLRYLTDIPCLATLYPAHAPETTAAMAIAAKTMCATNVRPDGGVAEAATTKALEPTVPAASRTDWAAKY